MEQTRDKNIIEKIIKIVGFTKGKLQSFEDESEFFCINPLTIYSNDSLNYCVLYMK